MMKLVALAAGAAAACVDDASWTFDLNGVDQCGFQPLVWGVPTKLQNSLAPSNRSRFGWFLDESIALVEFSKRS